jgi:DNA-directed RNA polymerase subunit RPC12/RpoP
MSLSNIIHNHTYAFNSIGESGVSVNPDPLLIDIQIKLHLCNLIYICKRCSFENVGRETCINCNSKLLTKPESIALNNLKLTIIKNKQKLEHSIINQILNLKIFNLSEIESIYNNIMYNLLKKV